MHNLTLSCAAAAALCVGSIDAQQLKMHGNAGSYPGPFALELTGATVGAPGLILLSATPGPIPLILIDPNDPRQLWVGPVGLLTFPGIFLPPGPTFKAPAFNLPNSPGFLDATLFVQGCTFPGATTLVGGLSQPAPVRLAPAGQFRDRRTQFTTPRAFFPVIPRSDCTQMLAGGGQGALLAQIATNTTEIYDSLTDSFFAGPNMVEERSIHTATQLTDSRWLIVGGVDQINDPTDTAEIYDPATDTFTAVGSMEFARAGHAAVLLPSGKVLVTGGLNSVSSQDPLGTINSAVQESEVFDPATNTWARAPNAVRGRAGHTAVKLPDGRFLFAGGIGWTRFIVKIPAFFSETEIYDPVANTFTAAATMSTGRALFPMVEIEPGKFLAPGGANSLVTLGQPTAAVDIYTADNGGGSWAPTQGLAAARTLHAAHDLGGRVLVFGGGDGSLTNPVALPATEVYDVAAGTWSAGPSMPSPRGGFGYYVGNYGQIHILGGGTNPTGTVDNFTAWYYR